MQWPPKMAEPRQRATRRESQLRSASSPSCSRRIARAVFNRADGFFYVEHQPDPKERARTTRSSREANRKVSGAPYYVSDVARDANNNEDCEQSKSRGESCGNSRSNSRSNNKGNKKGNSRGNTRMNALYDDGCVSKIYERRCACVCHHREGHVALWGSPSEEEALLYVAPLDSRGGSAGPMAAAEQPRRRHRHRKNDDEVNKSYDEDGSNSRKEWSILSGVPGLGRSLALHKSRSDSNQAWNSAPVSRPLPLPRATLAPRSPLASPLSSNSGSEESNEYSYAYADNALLRKSPAYIISRGQENIYEEIGSNEDEHYARLLADLHQMEEPGFKNRQQARCHARRWSNSTLDAWPLVNTDSSEVDSGVHVDSVQKVRKQSTTTLDRHNGCSETSFDSDFDSEPGLVTTKSSKMNSVSRMDTISRARGLRPGLESSSRKAHTVSNLEDLATKARVLLEHRSHSFDAHEKKTNSTKNGSSNSNVVSMWVSRAMRFGKQQHRRMLSKLASSNSLNQKQEDKNVEWELGTPTFTKRSTITKLWENS